MDNNISTEEATRLEQLRADACAKLREAEKAWFALACETPLGPQRERNFDVFENVRTAQRI